MTGTPRSANPHRLHIGICEATGKRQYTDRKRAKTVARQLGTGLQVFRCAECEMFHIGHRGPLTRDDHRTLTWIKQHKEAGK